MEALSNVDRFVVLLRQKLAERAAAKAGPARRPAAADRAAPVARPSPQRSIAALAAQAGADDRTLRRTVVEQLLTEQLGPELANAPRFQQIVERVAELMAADAELGAMLGDVLSEIRARG